MSLLTGIVAYWKFDENNGTTTTADATGNGYTGTLTGSTQWTTSGKINAGLTFNGSSQNVALAGSLQSLLPAALTMTAWINTTTVGVEQRIFQVGDTGGSPFVQYLLEIRSGNLNLGLQTGGTPNNWSSAASAITANTWQFCAATWDGTNIGVYLNGVSKVTGTQTGTINSTGAAATIGNSPAFGNYFSGTIDEVGLWSRALSSTEVSQLYNSGAGLQYPFSGGSTASLFRQNNLTGIGAGGPFFQNPLTRSVLGWRKALSGLLIPDRKLVPA